MSAEQRQLPLPRPLGNDPASLGEDLARHHHYTLGRSPRVARADDLFTALAYTLRDRAMANVARTRAAVEARSMRRACYLSMEYLLGRSLANAANNLDVEPGLRQALEAFGADYDAVREREHDAGLGNGGLGRLAACFLDSAASLALPVTGYGLRYRYGMFRQRIRDGHQVEAPDHWLRDGHPWEVERAELTRRVRFGGHTETHRAASGELVVRWVNTQDVLAIPFDVPVPGYRNGVANVLRLWSSAATDEFDLGEFNDGSYPESVAAKNDAEHISMVLYPNDATENGKVLRLRQQYLLAAASLGDVLSAWTMQHGKNFDDFADAYCFQLNDTHPSLAVAELMRQLVDEHGLGWDAAWSITTRSIAYTNHTLLPEALERWPVRMMRGLLPRPLEIIEEIDRRFRAEVAARYPGDSAREQSLAIIEDGPEPMVRMAALAIVASFSVNGVAALHTRLLAEGLFRDFHALWPARFNNKTNGITPRRWLAGCNPRLGKLLDDAIGSEWRTDARRLEALRPLADDASLRARWTTVKRANKQALAALVARECGVEFDADWLLAVQVKRIHEYKRQLLNALHLVHLYIKGCDGVAAKGAPRCALLAGKAAPGYFMAKLIIKLVTSVADVINAEPALRDRLRVAFLPNYCVSSMELICPAADLSEQISTAGKEASGTGNMKFMMNGALTIGTHDGANIEILDAVGEDHFFAFGLTTEQIAALRPSYSPAAIVAADADLRAVIDLIGSGHFSPQTPDLFRPLVDGLMSEHDPWMTAADFRAYVDAEAHAARAFEQREAWLRSSIVNTAASGRFSSDRTIRAYNRDIWRLEPIVFPAPDE